MPFFKTNKDIFIEPWNEEVFEENWSNYDKPFYPETLEWDYSRELSISDIEIWEQIYYESGNRGVYAAYRPYAEFYMITNYTPIGTTIGVETYYGNNARKKVYKRAAQLGMPIAVKKVWVDPQDMWKYA